MKMVGGSSGQWLAAIGMLERSHKVSAVAMSAARSRVSRSRVLSTLFESVYLLYHLVSLHLFIKEFSLLPVDVGTSPNHVKSGVFAWCVLWFVFNIATVDLCSVFRCAFALLC